MKTQPNILIFMTDHQRGDTIRRDSACITPNIDAFRKSAVTFTNAYCPAPHCCPSRASFFTGLYPSQHGVWNNVGVSNTLSRGLFEGVRTFSEDLRDAGYRLYFSGKWHVSQEEGPADRGFEMLHEPGSGTDYRKFRHVPEYSEWAMYDRKGYYSNGIDTGEEPRGEAQVVRPGYMRYTQYGIDEDPFRDSAAVQAAVERLKTMRDEPDTAPFALYVGPLGPHDPYFVPQRFLDLYPEDSLPLPDTFDDAMEDKPALYRRTRSRYSQLTREEHRESVRRFYAFCSYEDYLFGQVMDALEASGRKENTLVLYCSDHGDYVGEHGLWAKGLPCFRGAYDICSMAGGAGITNPDRDCAAPVSLADWAPTFLELAGIEVERTFAGRSLVPFLQGREPADWREDCFTQTNGNEVYGIQRAVWNRKWKYVFNSFDFDELYDLERDPGELHNLIYRPDPENSDYAPVVKEMCHKLWRFAWETHDNCVNPYIMTALAPFGPGIIQEDIGGSFYREPFRG
ncbi:sulfatase-like hydrolase/transferase [Ruminococcaceae bacterium OttesenSCG-928-L11]|nr:sulfatase-like hydrolase/transferase [Ruminococcaceae bacterium OttesenSCG-928-L11]